MAEITVNVPVDEGREVPRRTWVRTLRRWIADPSGYHRIVEHGREVGGPLLRGGSG